MKTIARKRLVPCLLLAMCLAWTVPFAQAHAEALEIRCGAGDETVVAGSALFAHVDNGLPGDVFVGSLNVVNESSEPCEVFVHPQDVVANGPEDMLERIPFTLRTNGEAVFDGVLAETEDAAPVSLGMCEPGEAASVDCMAVIPSELTSEYADAAVGMNVAVGMRALDEGNGATVATEPPGNPLVPTGASQGASLVQAGDVLAALPFVLGILAAAGTVIWCAWKRRMRMW